jgi:hypothetical protein
MIEERMELTDGVYARFLEYKKKNEFGHDSGAMYHLLQELRYTENDKRSINGHPIGKCKGCGSIWDISQNIWGNSTMKIAKKTKKGGAMRELATSFVSHLYHKP